MHERGLSGLVGALLGTGLAVAGCQVDAGVASPCCSCSYSGSCSETVYHERPPEAAPYDPDDCDRACQVENHCGPLVSSALGHCWAGEEDAGTDALPPGDDAD